MFSHNFLKNQKPHTPKNYKTIFEKKLFIWRVFSHPELFRVLNNIKKCFPEDFKLCQTPDAENVLRKYLLD